ncbi:unnamed protein product [Linum tenue]|uniref:Leucine-rich repeat-containing N-terminal plant-type domain-containing protein n=1 Tax=Linum tenue TaxID=586396 RepID=A0AAV0L0D2_9ROSI|nr:unnamed protein product [Linum tenue]
MHMGLSGTCSSAFGVVAAAALLLPLQLCLLTAAAAASGAGVLSNETDRMALLEFKAMISSDPLRALSSWNDSTHFCQWYGVSCSKRHVGRVTVLDLRSQKLAGSISPYNNLSFLKRLYLHNNSFSKGIPPEIGSLCRLEWLYLYNNSLTGEIPSNLLSPCSALTMFQAANNKLVGELPRLLNDSMNSRLGIFIAHINNLTGSIPPSYGNLSSLRILSLGENGLSGRVPETLGQMKSLMVLQLNLNNFSGEIPASIFNISSLGSVAFAVNQIHGSLPTNLGKSLPNLFELAVSSNQLTGSVPASLSNASNMVTLQLQYNNFTGSMPSMAGCRNLRVFLMKGPFLGEGQSVI